MVARILVALDGSPLAEQALPCAAALGQGLPAELVLFRAVSISSDVEEVLDRAQVEAEALADQLEAQASDYLRWMAASLRESGLQVSHVVQHGPAAESIVDYAANMEIDGIVMATHGYTGLKRWTHGSVAERVLQLADAPVLMVRAREEAPAGPPEPICCDRVLVPLDGSKMAEQVLPPLIPLARALGCGLILFQVPVVHVWGWSTGEWYMPIQGIMDTAMADAESYLEGVAQRLKEEGVEASTAVEIGAVSECIVDYAAANRVDLIAMCTHGRTGLARWTLGSVADRVLRGADVPILLVRAKNA